MIQIQRSGCLNFCVTLHVFFKQSDLGVNLRARIECIGVCAMHRDGGAQSDIAGVITSSVWGTVCVQLPSVQLTGRIVNGAFQVCGIARGPLDSCYVPAPDCMPSIHHHTWLMYKRVDGSVAIVLLFSPPASCRAMSVVKLCRNVYSQSTQQVPPQVRNASQLLLQNRAVVQVQEMGQPFNLHCCIIMNDVMRCRFHEGSLYSRHRPYPCYSHRDSVPC